MLCRANLSIFKSLIIFAIQSKRDQNSYFDCICLSEQTYSILRIWSYLLYRANLIKICVLIAFAYLSKCIQYYEFDHICYTEQTLSKWRICQQLPAHANFINTMSLITFADPSKHFKFSLLSTFATLCKLVGNSKFACFYIRSKRCAKKQKCSLICLVCKWASKKHICIRICFMSKCEEYS